VPFVMIPLAHIRSFASIYLFVVGYSDDV